MTCKTIEIRDRGTFVPALAVRLDPADERDRWLLSRAGFGTDAADQRGYVLLIIEHFNSVENGAVVDVEYLLGERPEPKRSEAETVSAR